MRPEALARVLGFLLEPTRWEFGVAFNKIHRCLPAPRAALVWWRGWQDPGQASLLCPSVLATPALGAFFPGWISVLSGAK